MNSRYNRYYTFIKPILRSTKVRTYSTLVFNLTAIAFLLVFAIQPTLATIISLRKAISQQQQVLDNLNNKAQNLSLGKENLKKIDPQTLTKLNTLIPNKTDLPSLVAALSSTISEASLSGLQVQPTDLVGQPPALSKKPSLSQINFTFNLTGTYDQLTSALNALNSSPRLISVDSINFNQPDQGNLIMSVTAKAYYVKN